MEVLIKNRQKKYDISRKKIREKAKIILHALDCHDGELSILIVDDARITELNRRHLDREGPTNVLAFPMDVNDFPEIPPKLIGDVVISVETAEREAAMAGIGTESRLYQLLVHGILHLFDYDHEKSEKGARVMAQKSRQLHKLIGMDI